ncbi:hypothetical protein AOQ73_10330 [Bradyrhizobium pachyrhizi]|nr:hypothetical protein AOQ73_10330 [Bradyrhizobium pachyrhizi]
MVRRGQKSICPTCDVLPLLIRKPTTVRAPGSRAPQPTTFPSSQCSAIRIACELGAAARRPAPRTLPDYEGPPALDFLRQLQR